MYQSIFTLNYLWILLSITAEQWIVSKNSRSLAFYPNHVFSNVENYLFVRKVVYKGIYNACKMGRFFGI